MDFELRQATLDQIRIDLLRAVKQLQSQKGLTIFEMENILYQVLTDVKTEKESLYADRILSLTSKVRQIEKEKTKEDKSNVIDKEEN